MKAQKPPLGVMPRYVWDELRKRELSDTIRRCLDAGYRILPEWVEEYNELTKEAPHD